jgi:hypothetical protein
MPQPSRKAADATAATLPPGGNRVATKYGAKLELTATIEELPLLAAWVVAWAAAKVTSDAGGAIELAAATADVGAIDEVSTFYKG